MLDANETVHDTGSTLVDLLSSFTRPRNLLGFPTFRDDLFTAQTVTLFVSSDSVRNENIVKQACYTSLNAIRSCPSW